MAELDDLDAELRALGQTLVVAAPADDLVEQVLARLPDRAGAVAYAGPGRRGRTASPAAGRGDHRPGSPRARL